LGAIAGALPTPFDLDLAEHLNVVGVNAFQAAFGSCCAQGPKGLHDASSFGDCLTLNFGPTVV